MEQILLYKKYFRAHQLRRALYHNLAFIRIVTWIYPYFLGMTTNPYPFNFQNAKSYFAKKERIGEVLVLRTIIIWCFVARLT